jgi:hypothetical protein
MLDVGARTFARGQRLPCPVSGGGLTLQHS